MRLLIACGLMLTTILASAQKILIPLKKGTVLSYLVSANGQSFPVTIEVDSIGPDYSKLAWSMGDQGSGFVVNGKNSSQSATRGYWADLHAGEEMTVGDDQTILFLSKSIWNALNTNKKFTYDDQEFILKELSDANAYKIKDKLIDVLYAETANGNSKLWILNNPSAPLILRYEGNPQGIDVDLQQFEQK